VLSLLTAWPNTRPIAYKRAATSVRTPEAQTGRGSAEFTDRLLKGGLSGSYDLLGDLVAKARQGARGETGARELLEMEKRMRLMKKSKMIIACAAIVGLAGSGAAYAYWTNSGSGSGTAATGTNVAVTVNQTSSITGLYPGQGAQALSGNFTNPNAGATYVTAVTATGYTIDAAHVSAGCTVAGGNYTLGGTSNLPGEVASGTGGSWSGLSITMNDLGTNQDSCKGATLTITYASS
jgi:hypothetical protein